MGTDGTIEDVAFRPDGDDTPGRCRGVFGRGFVETLAG